MGCAPSQTNAEEPVVVVKPRIFQFKSKTQNVQELVRKKFVDRKGKTFYVVPDGN